MITAVDPSTSARGEASTNLAARPSAHGKR